MKKTNPDFERICLYCEHSEPIVSDDVVLCSIKGITPPDGLCGKFVYDALKRIPPKKPAPPTLDYVDIDDDTDGDEKKDGAESASAEEKDNTSDKTSD